MNDILEQITAQLEGTSTHPNLDKLNSSREELAAILKFVAWLQDSKGYEICHQQHVSFTDRKVFVRIPEKPEWLIADYLGLDFRELNSELRGVARNIPISELSTERVIRMYGEE